MNDTENVCIAYIDKAGNYTFAICGNARMLVIDEGAPHDRVFEISTRITVEDLRKLLGDSPIGSAQDERHEAIAARVLAGMKGEKHLRPVS